MAGFDSAFYLNPKQLKELLSLLANGDNTLDEITSLFKSAFPEDSWLGVATTLQMLQSDSQLLAASISSAAETIVAFQVFQIMMKSSNTTTSRVAKTGFYDLMSSVEVQLRQDVRKSEQLKYREQSAHASASRKLGRDALDEEALRCRSILKLFAFKCISNSTESVSPNIILSMESEKVNAALDGMQQNAHVLKEPLSEMSIAVESEISQSSVGGLESISAVANSTVGASGLDALRIETVVPMVSRTAPVPPPPLQGELRTLIGGPLAETVCCDFTPHSSEWRTARKILAAAASTSVSDGDSNQLMEALKKPSVLTHSGISPAGLAMIAAKNAALAVNILKLLPSPTEFIDYFLLPNVVAVTVVDKVMVELHTTLEQEHVTKYVNVRSLHIKSQSSGEQGEAVKAFVKSLKTILSGNLALTGSNRDNVLSLTSKFTDVAEVAAFEDSIKK